MDFPPRNSYYCMPPNQASGYINDKIPGISRAANNAADSHSRANVKKNSIVITNSNLNTSRNQSLCRVGFQDNNCLALPPGITWEEINAPPFTRTDISHLLHYTTQLNYQLKKKKSRLRSNRNESSLSDQQYRKHVASVISNKQSMKKDNNTELKSNSVSSNNEINLVADGVKKRTISSSSEGTRKTVNTICEIERFKKFGSADNVEASSSSCTSENLAVDLDSEMDEKTDNIDKSIIKRNELLKLRSQEWTNPKIIKSLIKNGLLSASSSFSANLSLQTSSNTSNGSSSSQNSDCQNNMVEENSWIGSDDDPDDKKSREIYENLANLVEKFDIKFTDSSTNKKAKKKKKKKVENKQDDENIIEEKNTSNSSHKISEEAELFEDHYDVETIEGGLKNGTLFQGTLRINSKNWREAFVSSSRDESDVFIDGIKNRNRALDGDEVIVELLPDKQSDKEHKIQKNNSQKCGKVVGIIRENHPRTAVGSIKPVYHKKKRFLFLSPFDSKLPRIKIVLEQCLVKINIFFPSNTVYLAKITKWESTSNAEGIIVEEIGNETDPCVETKCILFENYLDVKPCVATYKKIPDLPYQIPIMEIDRRRDIRSECVFTIDPSGAKDLDDALSCTVLSNGNFEVGIHIADVSHFLKPDNHMDNNARKKATSVYLTQTVYHMLPLKLCELCSLTPNEDKLAFSVFVEFDSDANIIKHEFCKTVLRSCVQLTYAHAQDVIENYGESYEPTSFPPVVNGFTAKDCATKINILQCLAAKLRERRFAGGALKIDQPKIIFKLDTNNFPCSFSLYMGQECNWLIEEFMLLANIFAANKMRETFPDNALLRWHEPPKEKCLLAVVEHLEKVGICIDISDAGSIYRSMVQYEGTDEIGVARMAVITNLLVKPMMKAAYICSSERKNDETGFWHYALNTPYYTHFTSPIRRYADIVVHRLLAASLGFADSLDWPSEKIQEIAHNCNLKKNSSKKASDTSAELYLKMYLEKYGPLKARAVVLDVKERFFEIIDLSTRTISRIMVNKIEGAAKVKFKDESMPSLKITWENCRNDIKQILQIFTIVDVELSFRNTSGSRLLNKINVNLLKPII